MDHAHLTAPCGMDCFNCTAYLAGSDEKLRAFLAVHFGLDEKQAWCPGCRELGGKILLLKMDQPCKVWRCIEPQGLHNCSECQDFPCENLHPKADKADRRPHNLKVYNLSLIKKLGLEKWAEEEAARSRQTYFKTKLEL